MITVIGRLGQVAVKQAEDAASLAGVVGMTTGCDRDVPVHTERPHQHGHHREGCGGMAQELREAGHRDTLL